MKLLFIFFLIIQIKSDKWCELKDRANVITYSPDDKCLPNDNFAMGWSWMSYSGGWDVFHIREDCCGSDKTNRTKNYFYFLDESSSNKEFAFKYVVGGTVNARLKLNLDFHTTNPDICYFFHFDEIPENTEIYHSGRIGSDKSYTALKFYKKIVKYTINSTYSENVKLYFNEPEAPFTLLSGKMNLTFVAIPENKITTCMYPYYTYGEEVNLKDPIDDTHSGYGPFTNYVLCDLDHYKRIVTCGNSTKLDYEDCTCTYKDFEFQNRYTDCYQISEHRLFNILPDQEALPSQYIWYSFVISQDTTLLIPKRQNLTFVGNVEPPDHDMFFNGKVYLNTTLNITKSEHYFDLGTFYLEDTSIHESITDDQILFRGRLMNEDDEERLNSDLHIKQQHCGCSTRRFLKESSSIGCQCTQRN